MAGDGQVTFGQTVVKQTARKIRRLYNDKILAGFAGSAADSFALFARFEAKLEQYRGNLERSAVELAKDWRSDRILRRLEAMLVVMDANATFLLSGNGDLIEPDDGIVAIGSGGPFALAAAKALTANTTLDARAIAEKAMLIAGEICIYTNTSIVLDKSTTFLLSGNGDLIEPDDGLVAIGSGGPFALAAAKALAHNTDLDARAIAERAMAIASEICIYTNAQIVLEEL